MVSWLACIVRIAAMAQAASSLHATVMEVYESDWLGAYEMAQYTQVCFAEMFC